jgi:hypothetical protein
MEDFVKTLLAIVGVVIYVWSLARKKPAAQQKTPPSVGLPQLPEIKSTKEDKKVTFEELLREFEQSVAQSRPAAVPEESVQDRKKASAERRRLSEANREILKPNPDTLSRQPQRRGTEPTEPTSRYRSLELIPTTPPRSFPTLDEQLRNKQGRFDEYNNQTTEEHPVLSLLKNPESARQAFVMSEIFNRKW